MGFRTMAMTADYRIELPEWFIEKHTDMNHATSGEGKPSLPLTSKFERKFYASKDDELFTDLQKVIAADKWWNDKDLEIVLFHECDGITKVRITASTIQMFEPQKWEEVDHITHSYCYGCSTPDERGEANE